MTDTCKLAPDVVACLEETGDILHYRGERYLVEGEAETCEGDPVWLEDGTFIETRLPTGRFFITRLRRLET